jgi:hypothetical protein
MQKQYRRRNTKNTPTNVFMSKSMVLYLKKIYYIFNFSFLKKPRGISHDYRTQRLKSIEEAIISMI